MTSTRDVLPGLLLILVGLWAMAQVWVGRLPDRLIAWKDFYSTRAASPITPEIVAEMLRRGVSPLMIDDLIKQSQAAGVTPTSPTAGA